MFDKIVYIGDRTCNVKLKSDADVTFNLMNLHVVFEDKDKKILGEVDDIDEDIVKVRFLGEITSRGLLGGVIRKPTLDASIRVIEPDEVPLVVGKKKRGYMLLGKSPFYNGKDVFMDVNGFFSNHFAIFGNSGSGKSCGVSRVFQNMFLDKKLFPYKSNIIMFDSSGEYYNAFRNLSSINPNYNYRFISTNEVEGLGEALRIPIYLLSVDDLALLLNVTNHSQLPIIERMVKLARIFSEEKVDANSYKNHLIAQAIMTILYTNETSPNKRNEIFSILASCSTPEFNLEAELKGIGYTRKFRDCFLIDQFGNFTESVLMTEYVSSFIKEEYDSYEPEGDVFYTLDTLEKALNFTLISEGWLRNENTYGDSVTIKVRLHSLITGNNAKFFEYNEYVSLEQFISSLLIVNGKKYQLVNINLDDVDDTFAKVVVKVFSRLIFTFAKSLGDRASIPFHLVVEEAHRYIQNDTDTFLIGYNIFDRIAKEGRKYGVILGLITQRPVEMSDTVISQCSNFLIFKMNHPADVEYIRKMVPNISEEIVEKQKTLQAGTCLAFGQAFKIPLIVKLEMPNPEPRSGNCDVVTIWDGNGGRGGQDDDDEEEESEEVVEESKEKVETAPVSNEPPKEEEVDTNQGLSNLEAVPNLMSGNTQENNNTVAQPIPEVSSNEVNANSGVPASSNGNSLDSGNSLANQEIAIPEIPIANQAANNSNDPHNLMENVPGIDTNSSSQVATDVETGNNESTEQQAVNSENSENSSVIPNNLMENTSDKDSNNQSVIEEGNGAISRKSDEAENDESDSVPANNLMEGISTPITENNESNEKAVVDDNNAATSDGDKTVDINAGALNNSSAIPDFVGDNTTTVDQMLGVSNKGDNSNSVIPDVNVFVPNMVVPENATNISLNQQISNSQAIVPEIKQEEVKPSVIIPGGQNVGSALMEGFGGNVVKEENN